LQRDSVSLNAKPSFAHNRLNPLGDGGRWRTTSARAPSLAGLLGWRPWNLQLNFIARRSVA